MSDYGRSDYKLEFQHIVNLIHDYNQVDASDTKKLSELEDRINTIMKDLQSSTGKEEEISTLKRLAGRFDGLKTEKQAAREIKVSFELFRKMKAEK